MAKLQLVTETVDAINRAYEASHREEERTYLGASVIGDECERSLWYSFRWVSPPEKFTGRQLRLFQTGHREEARMIDDLRASGVTVWDVDPNTNQQWGISAVGGHFRGHADGVALGVKEAPKTAHLLECKTHKEKHFNNMRAHGVLKAFPKHYAQMQVYMHKLDLTRALYMAHCKGDDELWSERVHYDSVYAMSMLAKAESIITSDRPLPKLHENPQSKAAWACEYCRHNGACHQGKWARRNCRTCAHATVALDGDGRWVCERHHCDLSKDDQRAGCSHHIFIPDLVPGGTVVDADAQAGSITYRMKDGSTWVDKPEE